MKYTLITLVLGSLLIGGCVSLKKAPDYVAPTTAMEAPQPGPIPATTVEELAAFSKDSPGYHLTAIFNEVGVASTDPAKAAVLEAQLIALIQHPDADFLAIQAACDALGLIGTKKAVPALAALSQRGPEYASAARLALERIPGKEAQATLK